MSLKGIDIAWDRPTVADIKATGAGWVARYFSNDPTKDLTPGEVSQYKAAGLAIVTVRETSTGRALQGAHAGVQDAQQAIQERAACGLPQDAPIHFAVDMDTSWANVQSYFDGVTSVLGKDLTGIYGGIKVANGAHSYGLKYIWQADAWSYGQWSSWATIRQTGGTTLGGGADFDYAEVPDFGQYPRPEEVVTPQDKKDIADLVMNYPITSAFRKDAAGNPLIVKTYQYLEYLDNHFDITMAKFAELEAKIAAVSSGGVDAAALAKTVVHDIGQALDHA